MKSTGNNPCIDDLCIVALENKQRTGNEKHTQ